MPVERFFYTIHKPFTWSNGPHMYAFDPDRGYEPIESLERAKELADLYRVDKPGYAEHVMTTYGISYTD